LKVLEHAGLISRYRSAQWRASSLQAGPLREATEWMAPYRQLWDDSFNRLEAHLAEVVKKADSSSRKGTAP
jgi:hypothetical protein